jgi:hypothetical protein
MAVGTGIFFAALLIALVILYATTKDRWRWRTFVKRSAFAVLALIVAGLLAVAGIYIWNNLPPGLQKEYAGLEIGNSTAEVLYRRGSPNSVLGEGIKDPGMEGFREVIETAKIPKGKTINDYDTWNYGDAKFNVAVTFNTQKTAVVAIECYTSEPSGKCPLIDSINDGDTEAAVIHRFGQPDSSKIDGVTKMLFYRKIGVSFNLEKQRVYMLGINDTKWVKK